ncbi:hypothetical protein [Thalassovita taeanensis]|uniref:hypothetical protein n=1 Tax=Thalassovita taeanensis TaxID=657014 RepID=UPI000B7DBADB|nr:hypothetical protein [Thalassovita taeanensis]
MFITALAAHIGSQACSDVFDERQCFNNPMRGSAITEYPSALQLDANVGKFGPWCTKPPLAEPANSELPVFREKKVGIRGLASEIHLD